MYILLYSYYCWIFQRKLTNFPKCQLLTGDIYGIYIYVMYYLLNSTYKVQSTSNNFKAILALFITFMRAFDWIAMKIMLQSE